MATTVPPENDDTQPVTESRLLPVLEELRRREPIFHHPESGITRADFEAQTAPDFWEVGASGRRYDREFVWSVLQDRYAGPATPDTPGEPGEPQHPHCRELADGVYLFTYLLWQGQRLTRRATIWRRLDGGGWQIVYHQGTVVASG